MPIDIILSTIPARHRERYSGSLRKLSTISPEPCPRSPGITVHVALETLSSISRNMHQLVVEVFRTLTHLDSRLVRSLRYLLFRPGTLTVAYLEGPRKPYLTPFQLFLTANVIFFAVQSVTTVKVFSAPLEQIANRRGFGEQQLANWRIKQIMRQ